MSLTPSIFVGHKWVMFKAKEDTTRKLCLYPEHAGKHRSGDTEN
jgi:hypothetical protein